MVSSRETLDNLQLLFSFLLHAFVPMKSNCAFTLDIVYFCTSDGSFRILKKMSPPLPKHLYRKCTYTNENVSSENIPSYFEN